MGSYRAKFPKDQRIRATPTMRVKPKIKQKTTKTDRIQEDPSITQLHAA
jgi:hypothetical protein